MCPDHSYIMWNLDWNQRKMQEKYIFQTVSEHEKHRLSRAFVDVAWLCSRVEPQEERKKLSLDQVFVWVSDLAWACDPIKNQSLVSGQLKKKKLEPAIWWRGQRIPCFDRCQLTITLMSNIKDVCCKLVTVSNGVLPPGWASNLSPWYGYVYWSHWLTWRSGRTYGRKMTSWLFYQIFSHPWVTSIFLAMVLRALAPSARAELR